MKKSFIAFICFVSFISTNAQQTKGIFGQTNWLDNWTNFKPSISEYKDATQIITGKISSDRKLYKKNTYQLIGVVYVTNGAKLIIEPGTIIRGDSDSCGTLVITKGSSIIAEGTETDPIVFTSNKGVSNRKSGDWGGIIILGDAPINKIGGVGFLDFNLDPALSQYGGLNEDSYSGILKYVRIEFSGRKLSALKELNGLSLAGVGRKTIIDFVQISFSNDDSFECYGGVVNFNNLVSYKATDDDFDFTQGTQCNISNSIAIRNPYFSDVSDSRCFEIDSYDKKVNYDFYKKLTKIEATNITLINTEDNNQGLVREAIFIKENSYFGLRNSLISGFKQAILIEDGIKILSNNLDKIKLENLSINNCKGIIESEKGEKNDELTLLFANDNSTILISNEENKNLFINSDIKETPDFRIKEKQKLVIVNSSFNN